MPSAEKEKKFAGTIKQLEKTWNTGRTNCGNILLMTVSGLRETPFGRGGGTTKITAP